MLQVDQHRLRKWTLSQVQNLDLVSKQNWVASIKAACRAFKREGQPSCNGTLHAYFPPAPYLWLSFILSPRPSPRDSLVKIVIIGSSVFPAGKNPASPSGNILPYCLHRRGL